MNTQTTFIRQQCKYNVLRMVYTRLVESTISYYITYLEDNLETRSRAHKNS